MKASKIEWTENTFNPWMGCTKVSAGCANCYAEGMSKRMGYSIWGKGQPRKRTSENNWKQPLKWDKQAKAKGERTRVFCASMADWCDAEVDEQWRDDLFELIRKTPNLDWLLLTKRIERAVNYDFPDNVWVGTSAENQEMWDKRVPILISIPAKIRFVSAEPLLGPITMGKQQPEWLIVGGESGGHCRPMEKSWVTSLQNQCEAGNTAFFFKQWGGFRPKEHGRELDGKTYSEFPDSNPTKRTKAA